MKGIGMNKFSGICAAAGVVAASMLQGCVVPLHTQDFAAGEVDLQGKQLYFIPTPGEGAYQRQVVDITELGNNPAGDTAVAFTGGFFELVLGLGNAVNFYGQLHESLFIGEDGSIGMSEPGDNSSLTSHFMQPEVSLLPVDEIGTGAVSFEVLPGDSVAVTYAGVTAGAAPATAQAEFFINEDMYGDIALSYTVLDANAAGVYGLSNGQLDGADEATITQFLADFANQAPLTTEIMTGS